MSCHVMGGLCCWSSDEVSVCCGVKASDALSVCVASMMITTKKQKKNSLRQSAWVVLWWLTCLLELLVHAKPVVCCSTFFCVFSLLLGYYVQELDSSRHNTVRLSGSVCYQYWTLCDKASLQVWYSLSYMLQWHSETTPTSIILQLDDDVMYDRPLDFILPFT